VPSATPRPEEIDNGNRELSVEIFRERKISKTVKKVIAEGVKWAGGCRIWHPMPNPALT